MKKMMTTLFVFFCIVAYRPSGAVMDADVDGVVKVVPAGSAVSAEPPQPTLSQLTMHMSNVHVSPPQPPPPPPPPVCLLMLTCTHSPACKLTQWQIQDLPKGDHVVRAGREPKPGSGAAPPARSRGGVPGRGQGHETP